MSGIENIHELTNPIIAHKLAQLREKNTAPKNFRELIEEISMFLSYEVADNFEMQEIEIETPIKKCRVRKLNEKDFIIVAILRAGLAMLNGVLKILPDASVGHIGMYRDEITHKPVEYYSKVSVNLSSKTLLLVDPMLATGGSASKALKFLKNKGAEKIFFMCIVSAPEGIKKVRREHPDVSIYTAAIDESLNDNCYIVPGLGDAGDRIFATI